MGLNGARSRRKGGRIEREVVALLRAAGIPAARVPLSGAAGGAFAGDVLVAGRWRAEVKARAGGKGFTLLERWLAGADLLVLRRDRAAPLVLLPWRHAVELLARACEEGRPKRSEAFSLAICARAGCGQPLPTQSRQHGSARRFCSARCRRLAWQAGERQGTRTIGCGGPGSGLTRTAVPDATRNSMLLPPPENS